MPKFSKVSEAVTSLEDAFGSEYDNRERAREAQYFLETRDGQWEPEWTGQSFNKPRYTFDITNPIVDQVAGELEAVSFDIKIKPAGDTATKEIAGVYDGIIRSIESFSRASNIYNYAGRNVVACGVDGWEIEQGYRSDMSFDQDLLIKPIYDYTNRVWWDPNSIERDHSTAEYCHKLTVMSKQAYKEQFPNGSGQSVSSSRRAIVYYNRADYIVVATLYSMRERDTYIVKTSSGRVFEDDRKLRMVEDELALEGEAIIDRKKVKKRICYRRMYDGAVWLTDWERTVFSRIPIVTCYANFKVLDEGKLTYRGVVEKMLDPQRVLNFSLSREVEESSQAPRAKYWMTEVNAKGHEDTLRTLNTNADPVQFYNNDPQVPGPPQQQGGAQINPGLRNLSTAMLDIGQRASGLFAASIGEDPNVQSGIAIEKLQRRGSLGSVKYFEAMEIAINTTARILVDAIPQIYDTRRQIRITKEDGSSEDIIINDDVVDEETGMSVSLNDLSQGMYDVVCTTGPSYQTRQEELLKTLTDVGQQMPQALEMSLDLILNGLSSPQTSIIAERARKQLINSGIIPVEQMTQEELAQFQASQEAAANQPDPATLLAAAEQEKAAAARERVQVEAQKSQITFLEKQADLQLKDRKENRETEKMSFEMQLRQQEMALKEIIAQINAQSEQNKTTIDMVSTLADNVVKAVNAAQGLKDIIGADAIISPDIVETLDRQMDVIQDAQDDAT